MSKKSRLRARGATTSAGDRTATLRALRLAQEAASREAGTWGDMTVGEILHEESRSAFVQVWKGQRRPDPFDTQVARRATPRGPEWLAVVDWIAAEKSSGFGRRVVAWDLSAAEANRIAQARISELQSAGYTVINPAVAATRDDARPAGEVS